MLSYVFYGVGDFRAEERPIPTPAPGEALIKIAGCAICHTDLAIIDGDYPIPRVPALLGHEYAGTVQALGPGTSTVAVDDRVAVYSNPPCGLCAACRRGDPMLCAKRGRMDGGYSEYVALPERCLFKIPPELTDDQAISINPFSIAVQAVEVSGMRPGSAAVVIGGGAIGLEIVGMLRFSGASTIIVSEPLHQRHSLAMEFGADLTIDPTQQDLATEVSAVTGGIKADVVFEAVGSPRTVEQSLTVIRRGGTVVIVGAAAPQAEARIRPYEIFANNLTIRGSFGPSWSYPRAIELAPRIRPERVLTHRFPLSELPAAMDLRRRNVGIKALVVPGM